MNLAMAFPTEGDKVFFSIGAELASRCNVVNFQSGVCTAGLAPPAVALQD
jgi:hypothetical protein